ncbi:MAG: hypothetical protein QOD60_784, partial [Solirubrobacterales bacterium]|nr:hypothetical protein [Solirubrobacterales bacterium]
PDAHPRTAVLLGAEGPGLTPAAQAAVSVRARIPMRDGVDSLGVAAAAAIADDSANVKRVFRRMTMRRKPTWNVVAEAGDRNASRTLVLLAHHDAAQTGFIFSQGPQRRLYEWKPELIERGNTSVPLWWLVLSGPLTAALGGLLGSRRLGVTGAVLSAFSVISFADIARNDSVPGANDNLSGVAVLVAVAAALREQPIEGLRVLLVSCGSEEVLQGGIHGFAERHFPNLPPETTWFLNHDSVGSPHLSLLEGEGPMVMEDYEAAFKDQVANIAEEAEIPLRRKLRARVSTDAVIPNRAGYPVANFCSVNAWKSVSNYHWPSDVPENVEYGTVADAARLSYLIAERLARGG